MNTLQTPISIARLERQLHDGYRIGYDEAVALWRGASSGDLRALADRLREHFLGRDFDACSIINARSGRCTEDCKWCSQSRFHRTEIDVYPLIGAQPAIDLARHNASKGIRRFSLVTSGRAMSDGDMLKTCAIYRELGERVEIGLCASLGLLTLGQLIKLRSAGVTRYHCNLESAPSFFGRLCTTHTLEEKLQTLRWAREAGLEICSGGIIGMGETMEQRIELAVALRELGADSIPVNVLNPIPGTPLEGTPPLPDDELLDSAAMFRIVNPAAQIRLAGGRVLYEHLFPELIRCGISASIMGDMLTTAGSAIDRDMDVIRRAGFRTAQKTLPSREQ